MSQLNYVSDLYQWAIDDVISKVHSKFKIKEIKTFILNDLAEKWAKKILEMKICETTVKENFKIKYQPCPYIFEPNNLITEANHNQSWLLDKLLIYKTPYAQLYQTLLKYQEAISLLSFYYTKLPFERINDRKYYYYLYHQYINAAEYIHLQIQYINRQDKTTITRCSQSDLTSLQSDELSYDCKSTRTVIPTNSSNEVQKNYNKYHSDEKKPLFCDDNKVLGLVSHLADSKDKNIEAMSNSRLNFENRIDCCYEKIKHCKTDKSTRWQNILRNGIMLIDKKEFVFNKAMVDLTWEDKIEGSIYQGKEIKRINSIT